MEVAYLRFSRLIILECVRTKLAKKMKAKLVS